MTVLKFPSTELTREHNRWTLFIRYHTNTLDPLIPRDVVKGWLHPIHYGNCDTTKAWEVVNRYNRRFKRGKV